MQLPETRRMEREIGLQIDVAADPVETLARDRAKRIGRPPGGADFDAIHLAQGRRGARLALCLRARWRDQAQQDDGPPDTRHCRSAVKSHCYTAFHVQGARAPLAL